MKANINESMVQVVVIDISGIYVQIHNQGYFDKNTVTDIQEQYNDTEHWRVLVIE